MKLVGVGKLRFGKMRAATLKGEEHCPFDMRFVSREPKDPSDARQTVYHFLMTLYNEAAEPIPDGLNSNKRPRQGEHRFDPKNLDRSGMKHLPAASIMDYFRQCQSQHPAKQISRKMFSSVTRQARVIFWFQNDCCRKALVFVLLFCYSAIYPLLASWGAICEKVWMKDFKHLLRIRKSNHHARCSQCLRHRLIIRKLGHCLPARRAQMAQLQKHLKRQYADRQLYWESRSLSRLASSSSCPTVITAILDSMGVDRHAWPKSKCMSSKEFASWARPRLSSTTLLIHGHVALTVLSPHFVSCNSSRSTEILSHGLSLVSRDGVDLRGTHLQIQGDNCSKELKNNCILLWAAQQVAMRRLGSCTASFLTSGHSHEDIDGLFSNYSAWLDRMGDLETPQAFRRALERFMAVPEHREYERIKKVMMMSRFRDWPPSQR